MAPIRCAIIGTGMSLTIFHLPIILALPSRFTLHSVLERSGLASCRSSVGENAKIVSTLEEVVDDPDVELVIVSTPNRTHFEYCKVALEKGKHVLCEKPLTPTVKEAEELFALAERQNRILCVFQNRRWDADYLTVKKVLESGKLGALLEFHSHYDRFKPLSVVNKDAWKERPGEYNDAIYNLGSHIIDQALTLFGEPVKITCNSWGMRGVQGLDDSFSMSLEYPPQPDSLSPLYVHLHASILSAQDPQLRFSIKGTKGSYTKYGLDPQEAMLKTGKPSRGVGHGEEDPGMYGSLQLARDGGGEALEAPRRFPTVKGDYPAIYENLHEAITKRDSSVLVVTPSQAILNIRVIEAGLQSSREERTVAL